MQLRDSIRAVSVFEASKGILVLLAGFGVLSLIHHDVQHAAEQLIHHLHLNPAHHYPRIFIEDATAVTDTRLKLLAALAATYATIRFVEAYGLWRGRRWAEWLAAVGGTIYIPFEFYEMAEGVTTLSIVALILNVLIVALMIKALFQSREAEKVKS